MRAILALAVTFLSACSTQPKSEPPHLRQLSVSVPVTLASAQNGQFKGLSRIGRGSDGKQNLNVLLVHGIGWTQDSDARLLGHDLHAALSRSIGFKAEPFSQATHLCPQSGRTGPTDKGAPAGGLNLHLDEGQRFQSDDRQTPFNIWVVGCLDRTRLETPNGTVTIYRLLWDDAFYNSFDYLLVGYDDRIQTGHEQPQIDYGGYEDLAALRRPGTSRIRDSVLTYGMTDAALYMGSVGQLMRKAVLGAVCAAINDASGTTNDFDKLDAPGQQSPYVNVNITSACSAAAGAKSTPFAIVAESLGSRIVFDVLSKERDAILARKLEQVSGEELEVYLLANQIPVIAASRLTPIGTLSPAAAPTSTQIKYVAFTEVDDLLSYELVPYFEHLAYLRCRLADEKSRVLQNPQCGAADPASMARILKPDPQRRMELVRQLGFDVVDVRVKFSPPISQFAQDYADYQTAHTGYLRDEQVRRALLCGATDGKVRASSSGVCLE